MTEPLCIKIDGAWTALPLRSTEEMVVNDEGISISYEALEGSVDDQERLGAFRPDPPPKPPQGKEITTRTLRPDGERPVYDVTYGDAPEPGVPSVVQDWQFAWQAAAEGIITRDEALAWSGRGELPSSLKAAVDKIITDPDQHFGVMMMLVGAKSYERTNPQVPLLGAVFGKDAAGLDQFWRDASARGAALTGAALAA